MTDDLDPRAAGLEAQLDRLDDARSEGAVEPAPDPGAFDPHDDGFGFHLDDPDAELDPHGDDVEDHESQVATVGVLERLLTAFNHRDLEEVLAVVAHDGEAPGLLGYDTDNLPAALADLWERRPSVQLTRGRTEDGPIGVLWEHDGTTWWQLAAVCVDDVTDGQVGVLEFADDQDLLDRIRTHEPDDDLLEGERWQEWEDGVDS